MSSGPHLDTLLLLYPPFKVQIPQSDGLYNDIAAVGDACAPDASISEFRAPFWAAGREGPRQLFSEFGSGVFCGSLVAVQIDLPVHLLSQVGHRLKQVIWPSESLAQQPSR